MPFGVAHTIILQLSSWAIDGFFDKIEVINPENVPTSGPVIIASTHHNMVVDPAVLSTTFPHGRRLHYWAKSTLFAPGLPKKILTNAGVVPVYRGAGDNSALYKGSFDVLALGEVVAIFPEGTSYTEPHVMQIKDGVSFAALEYMKWLQTPEGKKTKHKDLVVVPASIVYTDKSRYRSSVVVEYGKPIHVSDYAAEFLSGAEKVTAKKLTKAIGLELVKMTVNAPNWETLLSARMARRLLWTDDKKIPLEDWVAINQTLCDLFSEPSPSRYLKKARSDLLEYYSLLKSSRLTNQSLSQLPLPRLLDPSVPARLPSRLLTLWVLLIDTFASLLRLPFFALPLLVHAPVYLMGRFGARMVEHEEETMAQNKIVFGLLSMLLIYPLLFVFLWALFYLSSPGFLVAAVTLAGFAIYHTHLIDDNYEHAKRLIAAWRVLIGVWGPSWWDLPLPKLEPYKQFVPPPPNPWLDINRPPKTPSPGPGAKPAAPPAPAPPVPVAAVTDANGAKKPKEPKIKRKRKLPSRHLVRHVLRARLQASASLAQFLTDVQRHGEEGRGKVRASEYLAKVHPISSSYPGFPNSDGVNGSITPSLEVPPASYGATGSTGTLPSGFDFLPMKGPTGWRDAKEVIEFLKVNGANLAGLPHVLDVEEDGNWAAATPNMLSGDEGEGAESDVDIAVSP